MNNFAELVHEAFIKPLRSVLIVDDEYPTWEEILNSYLDEGSRRSDLYDRSNAKPWRQNPTAPLQVIRKFRERDPGFVIDIHDALADIPLGDGIETIDQLSNHLHQSDLLVLDYNLEGPTGLRGTKAREILQSVLSNPHFNLVIVHTGEDSLEDVAEECVISLLTECRSKFSAREVANLDALEEKIEELEADGSFNRQDIKDFFDRTRYLYSRQYGYQHALKEFMANKGPLTALSTLSQRLGIENSQQRTFLLWAIKELEKEIAPEMSHTEFKGLEWSISDDNNKWIRTAKGFVCFVKKGPENLLEQLENALIDWRPTPSRLLSAKYRHEINRIGVDAEDDTLLKNHLFALFYRDIRNGGRNDILEDQKINFREQKLKEHVARQSEGISFLIEDDIVEFGKNIVKVDMQDGNDFLSHYEVDLENADDFKKAVSQYNNYVSTLPTKNGHEQLDSGHIFKIGNQWWVCATPACDLQPGQNTIAFEGKSKNMRPFTAFPLVPVNINELDNRHINGGGYCFVEFEGSIIALGIKSIGEEKKPADMKVHWQNFIAERGGLITDNKINIRQFSLSDDDVNIVKIEATVVCKLRYAYALNYIQRVGISTSRIGLEYVS